MNPGFNKLLAIFTLLSIGCASANAQLINPNFTQSDFTNIFPGSTPIADLPNATTIETTIDQAISQVEGLISYSGTPFQINFLSDPNISLSESVGTKTLDLIPYSTYRSDLQNESNKSADLTEAIASLPAGPGSGTNNNAQWVEMGGALLDAIGDTTQGNSLISSNGPAGVGGFAGTIALNLAQMNISAVEHELDEVLGIGGAGSTLNHGGTVTISGQTVSVIGPMDLYRYSAPGARSFSTSNEVSSYFSIDGGNTALVHFNQDPNGDFGDWGDGVTPADGLPNNPPQVQDAVARATAIPPNMGRNEAIALNVVGWQLTPAGLALEAVPEPGTFPLLLVGCGLMMFVVRRFHRAAAPASARDC
ncbi:MAG: NF038122 family metalloprotease [Verrucomicrobia bacterium]|nr:NF038122 family metalloprotease [Verrucomicrobiota bacterium]